MSGIPPPLTTVFPEAAHMMYFSPSVQPPWEVPLPP